MLNYYNRSNDDEKTVALYRYIDAQFDEIVKNDENGKLCLELHTDYKPKKNPAKNYDKVVKSGYKGMIIVPKPTSE